MLHKLSLLLRKIQFKLTNFRHWIEVVLKVFSVLFTVSALLAIVCEHGAYLSASEERWVSGFVAAAYVFFMDIQRKRTTVFEGKSVGFVCDYRGLCHSAFWQLYWSMALLIGGGRSALQHLAVSHILLLHVLC